ncbi:hypothetical protein E4T44_08924 [Aureobasidium sp. EXF-8845]|nr:hypothetical protein E4T44_08924 [Aureobasidium sp. EXF-8845]KAI4843002.1 hypothetical protein E4T45_08806 [Aureobasidium sp. EXF-8846]
MVSSSTATQRSDADNISIAPHIRAYDILIVRATDFLAAKDVTSAQRVARLLLRSPDLCRAHQMTCYEILAHNRPENNVYHTAQAMKVQSFNKGAAKMVIIPPCASHASQTALKSNNAATTRRTSIRKDDEWITSPPKVPTHTPKTAKKVTFAEPLNTIKENMKKAKVGKLFPELKARFEIQ